jgi:hypothetical protein
MQILLLAFRLRVLEARRAQCANTDAATLSRMQGLRGKAQSVTETINKELRAERW